MTPLREKMIKAMELRNLAKNTQRGYLTAVKGLASYYRQSPDKLTKDEIEDYLLYLKNSKGNTTGSCGAVAAGLRFFYTHGWKNPSPLSIGFAERMADSPRCSAKRTSGKSSTQRNLSNTDSFL